jgi:predicted nuclease of predicted toxin-antitoxin system
MRFMVDECVGPGIAAWLRTNSHDAISVFDLFTGMDDSDVLEKAVSGNRILITDDKDFGDMVVRQGMKHKGIVLLRLNDDHFPNRVRVLSRLLTQYSDQLKNNFVVVTEKAIRITHR